MQVDLADFQDRIRSFSTSSGMPSLEARFDQLALLDPYPGIPPALLHAGHLASYAIATGMIDPFDPLALQKPATYLVPLEGPVRYLDEDGNPCSFYLSDRKIPNEVDVRSEFILKPNSICYVTLRPTFRMPAYLAGRFNLLIKDVYRGLLVGTGPLVDPGFVGPLSIPVHNFTSTPYTFRAGDGFVYFEFTKLSWSNPNNSETPTWVPEQIEVQPPFPPSKSERKTLDDYIRQATGSGPPQNAIHTEIKRLSKINEKAEAQLNRITVGAIASGIVFLLTAGAVVVAAIALYLGVQQFTQAAQKDVIDGHDKLNIEIRSLRSEIEELKRAEKLLIPRSRSGSLVKRMLTFIFLGLYSYSSRLT